MPGEHVHSLLDDPNNLAPNLNSFINGFSENVCAIMEKFKFSEQVAHMAEKNILFEVIKAFAKVDLSPQRVDQIQMGYVFEELIRIGAEQSNEEAGEHFTPREVIVALPEQLFYNTGISTYIWVVTNRKAKNRKRKVQLIDARNFWVQMEKSLGNKRRRIGDPQDKPKDPNHIAEITRIYENFTDGKTRTFALDGKQNLRYTETVPLKESIEEYFKREVLPHVPDAWIDHSKTKVAYEIPLNRHFYRYEPPRELAAIEADIKELEGEILDLLREVTS